MQIIALNYTFKNNFEAMLSEQLFFSDLKNKLGINENNRILLAVSGGMDSMCMLHLFQNTFNHSQIAVAHCNFSLRGTESDDDELLVKTHCEQHQIRFFSNRFNTEKYAAENKLSIQEAARNLRYIWFTELCNTIEFDYTATAHHANDHSETILINIIRGTGIRGLKGIPAKNKNIIRPLLNYTKQVITDYATAHKIPYRNDSSNLSDKYLRNYIRLNIMPLMVQLNPEITKNLQKISEYAALTETLLEEHIAQLKQSCFQKQNNGFTIHTQSWISREYANILLFEMIKDSGFNYSQCDNIIAMGGKQSGRLFYSTSHQLLVNRQQLITTPIQQNDLQLFETITIQQLPSTVHITPDTTITFHIITRTDFLPDKQKLYLDFDKLNVQHLLIRKWEHGDYFKPFGMKGKKKLSDYFIDKKLSLSDKERCLLLTYQQKIAAVIPYQIDDDYKVTEHTKNVLVISYNLNFTTYH